MSRARVLPVGVLVLAFALAACSSSGGSGQGGDSSTPSQLARAADVDQRWNDFTGEKAQPCLKELFRVLFAPGRLGLENIKFGPVHVSQFNVGVGDRSVGYALVRSAANARQTLELDVDFVYVA